MKKIKHMTWIFIISSLVAILSILSAFLQYKKEKDDNIEKLKEVSEKLIKEKELTNVYQKLQNQSDSLISSTQKIVTIQDALIESQKKAQLLQEEIKNQITGGGNLPVIEPNAYNNAIGFMLINKGQYPISDIKVQVQDLSYLSIADKLTKDEITQAYNKSLTNIEIGTMAKSSAIPEFYKIGVNSKIESIGFNVNVSCRNGTFTYNVIFKRDENNIFKIKNSQIWGLNK